MSDSINALNSPFARMKDVPSFTVTSTDVTHEQPMDVRHASGAMGVEGGQDVSPHLKWEGFPAETQAFTVVCFDPDAPTASGFWHWMVTDIPADITELATDAGNPDKDLLPAGAVVMNNDAGAPQYIGSAPPAGHGAHRYYFIVFAQSEKLGLDASASNAFVIFNLFEKSIARGYIAPTFEIA